MVAKLRIVVVFKTPRPPRAPRPETGHPGLDADAREAQRRTIHAREEHAASLAVVRQALRKSHPEAQLSDDPTVLCDWPADLVVTVGGDGTFLHASRQVRDAVMLGVNSAPGTSTGHYCAATAETFAEHLAAFAAGQVGPPAPLTRIAVSVDGVAAPFPALNDVLFANRSPVASSRYALRVDDHGELQLSSGLWIATATGSTAAIRLAGGDAMAHDDRRLQYLVREPYRVEAMTLRRGFSAAPIDLLSRGDHNAVFVDGDEAGIAAPYGARVTLSNDAPPLLVLGYPRASA